MRWIILLLLVILISGCTILGYNFDFGGTGSSSGSDPSGLVMNFEPGTPPSGRTLDENEPFQVGINLKNTGDNQMAGELCIGDSFLYRSYMGIPDSECKMIYLGGVKEGKYEPEQKIYFPNDEEEYRYTGIIPGFSQPDVITASFSYLLNTVTTVSFNGIGYSNIETISGDSRIKNMKAPLVVSSIDKYYANSTKPSSSGILKATIKLNKITEGEVMDLITFKVKFVGGPEFNCIPGNNKLLFDKNEKIIKCTITSSIGKDYINQPLEIYLNYKFKKIISTQMVLKREEV